MEGPIQFVSGFVDLFLLRIILHLGRHDKAGAVYELPAIAAMVIGWAAIFKSRKATKQSDRSSAAQTWEKRTDPSQGR